MPAAKPPAETDSLDVRVDAVAIGVSLLCIVHCVGSIMLLSLLTSVGGLVLADNVHRIGLAVAVFLGGVALGLGFRHHRRPLPMTLGVAGLVLMATALTVEHGWQEAVVTIVGTALLAIGHWLNMRARHDHRA